MMNEQEPTAIEDLRLEVEQLRKSLEHMKHRRIARPLIFTLIPGLVLALTAVLAGPAGATTGTPRIVRGHVSVFTGNGTGYTMTKEQSYINGRIHVKFDVKFNTPFTSLPVVVAAPATSCYDFVNEAATTKKDGFKVTLTGCAAFNFVALESSGDLLHLQLD